MLTRKWTVRQQPEEETAALSRTLGILPLTAKLLWNRGYRTAEEALPFLRREEDAFHDPFLMRDMDKAVRRIGEALEQHEKITIFGDYDVDGVTATCILWQYLYDRGADVHFYIPGRLDEGYGLGTEAVRRIAADGTKLIVTVDTGVTAVAEAELIRSLGMELVVTDHHECRPELPDCCAVVNPRRPDCEYPFKELAGVGVVFKLICAMETEALGDADTEEKISRTRAVCLRFSEYTAVGTIADVMPLQDENRLIVNLGLGLLQKTEKPGLLALIDRATSPAPSETRSKYPQKKRKITSSFIGYTIAPRINAAGRIARASRAVELFLTDSPEEADRIAAELCDANRERQETENNIALEAFAQIEAEHDLDSECILILTGEHWHHGVIGIVASRITEKYHIPTILISFEGDTGVGKGSGRSVEGFDLVQGLNACDELLVKFGGHALAAGLTVTRENLPAFRERIGVLAKEAFGGKIPPPELCIDCDTAFSDVNLAAAEELYLLEPFGTANPVPLFSLCGAKIVSVTALSGGKHTKLMLCDPRDEDIQRTAMLFGVRTESFPYRAGDLIDAAYQMDVNEFQGSRTVQMILQDVRPHEGCPNYSVREEAIYGDILAGRPVSCAPVVPTREECAAVWMLLRNTTPALDYMTISYHAGLPYHKIRLILDVFAETGLLEVRSRTHGGMNAVPAKTGGQKIDLREAPLMRFLSAHYI